MSNAAFVLCCYVWMSAIVLFGGIKHLANEDHLPWGIVAVFAVAWPCLFIVGTLAWLENSRVKRRGGN